MKRVAYKQFSDMFGEDAQKMFRDFYPNVEMNFISSIENPFFTNFAVIIELPEHATHIQVIVSAVKMANNEMSMLQPSFLGNLQEIIDSFSVEDVVENEEFCVEILVNNSNEINEEEGTFLFTATQMEERIFNIINRVANTEPTMNNLKRGDLDM